VKLEVFRTCGASVWSFSRGKVFTEFVNFSNSPCSGDETVQHVFLQSVLNIVSVSNVTGFVY
jgi:hypothetical protein